MMAPDGDETVTAAEGAEMCTRAGGSHPRGRAAVGTAWALTCRGARRQRRASPHAPKQVQSLSISLLNI